MLPVNVHGPVIPVQLAWIHSFLYSSMMLEPSQAEPITSVTGCAGTAAHCPPPQQALRRITWSSCRVPHQYVDVGLHWAAGSSQTAVAEYRPPSESVHMTVASEDVTTVSSTHHRTSCWSDLSPVMMQTSSWETPGPAGTDENSWTDGAPAPAQSHTSVSQRVCTRTSTQLSWSCF